MATTIPVDGRVRDCLRLYGSASMTYSEILVRLMEEVDRRAFVEAQRNRLQKLRDEDLVDLKDVE